MFSENVLISPLFLNIIKCLISVVIKGYSDSGFLSAVWSCCSPVAASLVVVTFRCSLFSLLKPERFSLCILCSSIILKKIVPHSLFSPPFYFTSLSFERLALCEGLSLNLSEPRILSPTYMRSLKRETLGSWKWQMCSGPSVTYHASL